MEGQSERKNNTEKEEDQGKTEVLCCMIIMEKVGQQQKREERQNEGKDRNEEVSGNKEEEEEEGEGSRSVFLQYYLRREMEIGKQKEDKIGESKRNWKHGRGEVEGDATSVFPHQSRAQIATSRIHKGKSFE